VKALALVLLLASGAWSQTLGYGIKAGVPFTEAFSVGATGQTSHFVIGPMFELRVPVVGLEVDALYHSISYTQSSGSGVSLGGIKLSGSQWQFPIVGKVRLPTTPILKPYGEAGLVFRAFTNEPPGPAQSKKGFVMGAGLDIHVIVLHISPGLRYTRWGKPSLVNLLANPNQFEFLVGFSR
jgi:hypothetical protein